jgi:hypothetical protein
MKTSIVPPVTGGGPTPEIQTCIGGYLLQLVSQRRCVTRLLQSADVTCNHFPLLNESLLCYGRTPTLQQTLTMSAVTDIVNSLLIHGHYWSFIYMNLAQQ